MKKNEKKEIIKNLINEISQTNDIDLYSIKRSTLFNEVITSGYSSQNLQTVIEATKTWCKDFDDYMEKKVVNVTSNNDKEFIALASLGLLTLIDISLLEN